MKNELINIPSFPPITKLNFLVQKPKNNRNKKPNQNHSFIYCKTTTFTGINTNENIYPPKNKDFFILIEPSIPPEAFLSPQSSSFLLKPLIKQNLQLNLKILKKKILFGKKERDSHLKCTFNTIEDTNKIKYQYTITKEEKSPLELLLQQEKNEIVSIQENLTQIESENKELELQTHKEEVNIFFISIKINDFKSENEIINQVNEQIQNDIKRVKKNILMLQGKITSENSNNKINRNYNAI